MKLTRVLVVEDDADIQKVVRMSLKMRGVGEIVVVDSGSECIERLARFTPDVILLDVMMPHLDGYETCRRIKQDPATCDIPVVFLTARAQKADRERGMKLGALGYVIKPFDPMTLHDQILALFPGASGGKGEKGAGGKP
ncbi:MAG TPA: response regulator [Candidatus Acidoferrales bacterium]|nr:response regulator [Candidatus Acidoferrales bacterium]